jgi:hypothetical protein
LEQALFWFDKSGLAISLRIAAALLLKQPVRLLPVSP